VIIIAFGVMLYAQWAWNLHFLPAWMTSLDYSNYIYPSWWAKYYYHVP
jgi:hypothetical protein